MVSLLDPVQIGNIQLKNRLVMPPMATAKAAADGCVTDEIIDYYEQRAQGGYISLIIIEHSYVSPTGKAHPKQLSVANDHCIAGLRNLAETINQCGTTAVMQINHAGSAAKEEVINTKPAGPSAIAHPWQKVTPRELTLAEITDIIQDFQQAALRVKAAGFNGVEIHSAHGYLLDQFFSPYSNKRTDAYGGTPQKRIRIHLEIIDAIRQVTGDDFMILLRLGASDYREDGATIEHGIMAAKEFEKAGVNILDISGGFNGFMIPGNNEQGYFAPLTEAIKQHVSIPVILTGGITEAQAANSLLSQGKADLIGVGRAILHNPEWARNAIESLIKP